MNRWLSVFLAMLFLLFSFLALRLAYADYLFRTGTPENIQHAVQMFPTNPEYQAKSGNLRRSLELNPYQSAAWMELASESEARGDLATAEREFRKAAEVDAMFEPRWALANFYFRRDRREDFWKWMRLAAERSYGDRAGLFQLAWRSGAAGPEIQARVVDGLGDTLGRYVEWLGRNGKWAEAGEASLALVKAGQRKDAEIAYETCHQLLEHGETEAARAAWNALTTAGWIAGTAVGEGMITNGRLEWKPTAKAFDWRLPWRPGLEHRWRRGELTIALDGKQENRTDLLEQVLAVKAGATYEFAFRYRADGLAKPSGVCWRVRTAGTERTGEWLSSGDWRDGRFRFKVPPTGGPVRLVLTYERLPGTVRPEATIVLEGSMQLSDQK